MLEYLAYALFGVGMVGCIFYVMRALETEDAKSPSDQGQSHKAARPAVWRKLWQRSPQN